MPEMVRELDLGPCRESILRYHPLLYVHVKVARRVSLSTGNLPIGSL